MKDNDRILLKKAVQGLIKEEELRLQQELIKVTCRLTMNKDAHVPDTLTRIRVLPTVSVVGQVEKVERGEKGKAILVVYIKFLPDKGSQTSNLVKLGKLIKSLPGIEIVTFLTLGGRKIMYMGKPLVL